MDFRSKLFLGTLGLILVISGGILLFNQKSDPFDQTAQSYKPGVSTTVDTAIAQAQALYQKKKAAGDDLSSGPCLSNDLMPGWVADLVHQPRTQIDNQPVNQCQAYLEGRATHFVELDLNGNLVRVH